MDIGRVLLDILVVLLAAKVAAEVAERLRLPAVVGEIVAGVIIGPSLLHFVSSTETLQVLGELGVILLLVEVGMQMDVRELSAVGRASTLVAAIGVALPLIGGYAVMRGLGHTSNSALFVGAALTATSVGITARVFSDLRALGSVEARVVLGAAVIDDVLGLVILTVVVRLVDVGSVSLLGLLGIVGAATVFLVGATAFGRLVAPPLFRNVSRHSRSAGTLVAVALAFCLAFARLADAAGLAPIVGAFVAGLALSGSSESERIRRDLTPVGHLFIPVFFLEIGIAARVSEFWRPAVLGLAALLILVAVFGKLLAAAGAFGTPSDKLLVGIGMLPRGEVGLIFATLGLRQGILGRDLYAALLLMVLVTTIVTPPLLRLRLVRLRGRRRVDVASSAPPGGWLTESQGQIELVAEPPEWLALRIGLEAASRVDAAQPGPRLLAYLAHPTETPDRWDDESTKMFFSVLRGGSVRSWRFLETSGLLDRALPELATAVARRRADPFLLDPSSVMQFALVDDLRELVASDPEATAEYAALAHPEWLLLATLILAIAGDAEPPPTEAARRLARRLELGPAAQDEIALLVGNTALLRAAARRPDGFVEETVFGLAAHLDRPERARALYLAELARGGIDGHERSALDELYRRVQLVLQQPDLSAVEARNLVDQRRLEATAIVGNNPASVERITHAPHAYVLSVGAEDLARHATMFVPPLARHEVRVKIRPAGDNGWVVELTARDRPGLLARASGVLSKLELDVEDALVVTWPDGGALESFRLRDPADGSHPSPDAAILEQAIVASLDTPMRSEPIRQADVSFDDEGSPWYTRCEVRCDDRPGLLHTITVALAAAGASVHSARVASEDGRAVDRFELTDRAGAKLGDQMKRRVTDAIRNGVADKRRRSSRSPVG